MKIFKQQYIPTCFNDLVFSDLDIWQRLRDFADNKRHDSIILHGPHGTGKTETAKILVKERLRGSVYGNVDFHRACDVTDDIVQIVTNTWIYERLNGVQMPVSIFDEADKIKQDILYNLRWEIDERCDLGCFIFTTNRLDKIDTGISDRCYVIDIPAANTEHWFDRARLILNQENASMSEEKLRDLLATCDGSIRDLMRALEDAVLKARRDAA